MNDDMDYGNQGSIGGSLLIFLAGVALGAGLAMLYAPQAGIETRAKIAEKTSEIKDKVSDISSQVATKASDLKTRVAAQARDTLDRASEAMGRAADNVDQAAASAPPVGA